jgi:hypothetical protein
MNKDNVTMAVVRGVLEIELKPGINGADFEKFFLEEYASKLKLPGAQFFLYKGDWGEWDGKYIFLTTFESVERRDELVPSTGVGGGAWAQWCVQLTDIGLLCADCTPIHPNIWIFVQ